MLTILGLWPVRDLSSAEARVCFKLHRNRCFGKGHMLVDNVVRGFPSHETNAVKKAVLALIRDGILVEHPTRHGTAIHIAAGQRLRLWAALRRTPDFAWLPK